MVEGRGGRPNGRTIYLATIAAVLGVVGGVAMGATIPAPGIVTQTGGIYSGANQAPVGFAQSPTLSYAPVPASVATCSAAALTETGSGATINVTVSDVTGATACKGGDPAELFTVQYSATVNSGSPRTDLFTITTSYNTSSTPRTTGFNTVSLTTGSPGSPWTQTIKIYVDYGSTMPTVDTISLVIQ